MIIGPAVYSISSGTSAGYLTLSSVFGLHVKSVVSVRKDGEDSLECVVTEVIHGSSPGIRVRARSTTNYPSYGATNVSAYTGGTVQLPRQDWVPESGQGNLRLGVTIGGTRDVIVLAVARLTGAAEDFYASVVWQEF